MAHGVAIRGAGLDNRTSVSGAEVPPDSSTGSWAPPVFSHGGRNDFAKEARRPSGQPTEPDSTPRTRIAGRSPARGPGSAIFPDI